MGPHQDVLEEADEEVSEREERAHQRAKLLAQSATAHTAEVLEMEALRVRSSLITDEELRAIAHCSE